MYSRQIKFRVWDKTLGKFVPWNSIGKIDFGDSLYIYQQFTDSLDKNNKEIYEGDIINYGNLNYRVVWYDWLSRYHLECPYYITYKVMAHEDFSSHVGRCSKIIGNILQNPELLNGK